MPGRSLAERLGEFMHAACVRWGSRAYPNSLFIACWEGGPAVGDGDDRSGDSSGDDDDGEAISPTVERVGEQRIDEEDEKDGENGVEKEKEEEGEEGRELEGTHKGGGFQLYVVDPNGAARRYRAACAGRGSTRARKWLHRRSEVSAGSGGGDGEGKRPSPLPRQAGDGGEEEGGVAGGAAGGLRENDDTRRSRRRHSDSGKQRDRRPLSQMTCAEAARALVREAGRVGGGGGGDGGGGGGGGVGVGGGDVASSTEVAWLSLAGTKRRRASSDRGGDEGEGAVFVHHRSTGGLFGKEGGKSPGGARDDAGVEVDGEESHADSEG